MGRWRTARADLYPFRAADTGRWTWTVGGLLEWECGPIGSGWIIGIEQGFTSDLGSIPRLARFLFNPADPQCARAYLLHDKINTATREALPYWLDGMSSQFAASQLYEAFAVDGVGLINRELQFYGVLMGIAFNERVIQREVR